MTKEPADKPAKPQPKQARADREAAALRANLLKRKDQARRREEAKAKPDQ
ncbi:MAG: hypothetical protein P4L90_29685 [Rhodopila sp.]|nr:hypothetical protein [Rhodopila sp.]